MNDTTSSIGSAVWIQSDISSSSYERPFSDNLPINYTINVGSNAFIKSTVVPPISGGNTNTLLSKGINLVSYAQNDRITNNNFGLKSEVTLNVDGTVIASVDGTIPKSNAFVHAINIEDEQKPKGSGTDIITSKYTINVGETRVVQTNAKDTSGVQTKVGARLYHQPKDGGVAPFIEANWIHNSMDSIADLGTQTFKS